MLVLLVVFNVCVHACILLMYGMFHSHTRAHAHTHRKNLGQCLLMPTKPVLLLKKSLKHLPSIFCIIDV